MNIAMFIAGMVLLVLGIPSIVIPPLVGFIDWDFGFVYLRWIIVGIIFVAAGINLIQRSEF